MNYQIITDSCCDFPDELYAELQLTVVPVTVLYQGTERDDTNGPHLKDFYNGLRAGETASTSAINPQRWACAMEEALSQDKDVLVMAFSSGLSTTYQSAVIAAEELKEKYPHRKILVVDTLCASLGQGLLVWHACRKRDAGVDLDTLYNWVEDTKHHMCQWFTVEDLMYLKRGGRVSTTTALVGTMLQIKPVLHVDKEGHLINKAKSRGRKASIEALADKMQQLGEGWDNKTIAISHGDCPEEAALLAGILKERCGVEQVIMSHVGAVIGSHAGPGTIALFFLGEHR